MPIAVDLKPLGKLLAEGFSKSSLRKAFVRFSCERDPDVSRFLKAHAIQNEGTGASRTYLALSSAGMDEGRLEVVAFVTLAITVTDYSSVDIRRRLEIMGHVPGLGSLNFFPGYLVAQLARDDRYTHHDFDAAKLLPFAEDMLLRSVEVAGGRLVYLDCREELLAYYQKQGYEPLYHDDTKGLYKLVKPLA